MNTWEGLKMTITVSEKSRSHKNRLMAAGAAAVLVAGGAYYIGRVYPPHGMMTAGTIAAADRYRSSQVQTADVALGEAGLQVWRPDWSATSFPSFRG